MIRKLAKLLRQEVQHNKLKQLLVTAEVPGKISQKVQFLTADHHFP